MNTLCVELQAVIVFVSQIVFVYLRTLNIRAITEKKVILAMVSGAAQALTGLIGLAIGIHSIIDFNLLPILAYLLGGILGILLAMIQKSNFRIKSFSLRSLFENTPEIRL